MDIFSLIIGKVGLFMVVLTRVSGIFSIAPFFGSKNLPVQVKIGLAFFITLLVFPTIATNNHVAEPSVLGAFIGIIVKEFMVGMIIGFASYLVFAAIQMAGGLIDIQVGFGIVSVLDPQSGTQMPLIGTFKYLLAMLLFLGVNGHHVIITVLSESFQKFPVGMVISGDNVMLHIVNMFTAAFSFAFKIALPILATLFLLDVAFGIMNRTVPQMNVFMVGMPVKIAVGFFVMALALPVFLLVVQFGFTGMYSDLHRLLEILRP